MNISDGNVILGAEFLVEGMLVQGQDGGEYEVLKAERETNPVLGDVMYATLDNYGSMMLKIGQRIRVKGEIVEGEVRPRILYHACAECRRIDGTHKLDCSRRG